MVKRKEPDNPQLPEWVLEWEDAERPSRGRQKYETDTMVEELIKTVETGKAKTLAVDEAMLRKIHMHFRNAVRRKDLEFHFKTIAPGKMLLWAEKLKETTK